MRCAAVPSSSTRKEPRLNGTMPLSTMVTPWAATCWPRWVARIEVRLRIVSPSMLWPKHSCTITPPQPEATTTG